MIMLLIRMSRGLCLEPRSMALKELCYGMGRRHPGVPTTLASPETGLKGIAKALRRVMPGRPGHRFHIPPCPLPLRAFHELAARVRAEEKTMRLRRMPAVLLPLGPLSCSPLFAARSHDHGPLQTTRASSSSRRKRRSLPAARPEPVLGAGPAHRRTARGLEPLPVVAPRAPARALARGFQLRRSLRSGRRLRLVRERHD